MSSKKKLFSYTISLFTIGLLISIEAYPVYAQESEIKPNGLVEMAGEISKHPIDPENPEKIVDPGPSASTDGKLRFDFVSTLNFGRNKIDRSKRSYFVNAQLFHDGTSARANYIQVTDERSGKLGWTLQVRQEYQFKNPVIQEQDQQELKGATLSFDHGWANSIYTWESAPTVTKDTIEINELATTQNIATANKGSGKGQWIIQFGASKTNKAEREETLFIKKDEAGKPVIDPDFDNQEVYGNQAIVLSVPKETSIKPVQYQTELTWILAALPE